MVLLASSGVDIAAFTPALLTVALVLGLFHAAAFVRYLRLERLRRYPPVRGRVVSIDRVENEEGGWSRVMRVSYTPELGAGAGVVRTARARVRAIARYETSVGTQVDVYVDPARPDRVLIPESGNPNVPWLVSLLLLDAVLAATLAWPFCGG